MSQAKTEQRTSGVVQPSPAELAVLATTERIGYRLADLIARRASGASRAWNSSVLVAVTALLIRRRLRVTGLAHVHALDPGRGTVLVANHRSFFDFFAVACALFSRTRLSRRLLFPVRASFFYDHPLGLVINLLLAGMTMFPPIQRDPRKRAFNAYTLRRCAAELEQHRVVMGLHPEGTRSRDPDPLRLGGGKLGIGEILLAAPSAQVVPVFVAGLSNGLGTELRRNWGAPGRHPVHVGFGPPIDLSDLRASAGDRRAQREAVSRCMSAIRSVGESLGPELRRQAPPADATRDAPPRPQTERS